MIFCTLCGENVDHDEEHSCQDLDEEVGSLFDAPEVSDEE